PQSAVLVGDSTWDPLGYTGKANKNVIPAYLAEVDPWLGETACESCFVQLNGEDPLSESAFLIDMWLGRFPVETNAELNVIIDKIIGYENATNLLAPWRSRSVFLADNYYYPDGQKDKAGDFAFFSDNAVELQDDAILTTRVYYDPFPRLSDPGNLEGWREPNVTKARVKAFEAMNAGAGIVTYNGHSHHEQWAVTDTSFARPYLFNSIDVKDLTNQDALFIGLSMTCFTSQFIKTASEGHVTLDEDLLLHAGGGAVTMWGPAGLSVAWGHDYLQTGFHQALWSKKPFTARVGELVEAGYTNLATTGTCCQDVAHTFLIVGDPLTKVRAAPTDRLYLPLVVR
ncbi:MAG: hypothetical protein HC802_04620, partial [Caldilineaceae bacterium]|nr:hypothetical protein [Caldilineaceae bacterium]